MQEAISQLKEMKLRGMVEGIEEQLNNDEYKNLSFEQRVSLLVQKEYVIRKNRQLDTRLKRAGFRLEASIEGLIFNNNRNLDQERIFRLGNCEWIKSHQNMIITGPTGSGKTYLACAFGHRACLKGYRVKFYRFSRFFSEIEVARKAGKLLRFYANLGKIDVLVFDDWGINSINQSEALSLLEILEDRYQKRSTIISAQIPVEKWYDTIEDPTIADAILDRLVHNSHQFELTGQSIRKMQKNKGGT
jgi:DNA replication protein DnaC